MRLHVIHLPHGNQAGLKRMLGALGLCLLLAPAAASAQTPRLVLSITESIGATNGSQCVAEDLPSTAPGGMTLTENDVTAWSRADGRWTLDPARFSESGAGNGMSDHCFVLALDGKIVSRGLALWVYSARLTGYPTLNIIPKDGALILQLTSGNHRNFGRLHTQELDAILGSLPSPATRP